MIFYEVIRRGKRHGPYRSLIQTDNRERAERVFEREAAKLRDGWLALIADGCFKLKSCNGGYNRTRW